MARKPNAAGKPPTIDLDDPAWYLNREISQIEFNRRVLAQTGDPATPLLARLRFLTICSNNLDEFFEIRAAGLKQRIVFGPGARGPAGLTPSQILVSVTDAVRALVSEQYRVLNEELLPELADRGIRLQRRQSWSAAQREYSAAYFRDEVLPLVAPVAIDPAHPFPTVANKSLNFVVRIRGEDAFGRRPELAIVPVPRSLPRVLRLPPARKDASDFTLLSSVIHAHVHELFPGLEVLSAHQFRVTRDSELWVDEEESEDLLAALAGELPHRGYGDAVRLEVADNCPDDLAAELLEQFDLGPGELYPVNGPVNLHRLGALVEMADRPELDWPAFTPSVPVRREGRRSIFEAASERSVLLHHPFESFQPVQELLQDAARDDAVLAIKQTLYRAGADSPIVSALVEAARAGKDVTVVVELRARFDEAANIEFATRLRAAGANVVYGIVGFKAHAKLLLIVRREGDRLRRYAHLGTGNYHWKTTRTYTDLGLITSDPEITADVHEVFLQLTGASERRPLKRLLASPFSLLPTLLRLIDDEIAEARAGRPASIRARMNSIGEPEVEKALFRASQAGVRVELLVRGVCCFRPGVPGVSERISVRSVVGRFLEHSRLWLFHAGGKRLCYAGSADWMTRNLSRRVEVMFPLDGDMRDRAVREMLDLYFEDNAQAWQLGADGAWVRVIRREDEPPRSAQATLLAHYEGKGEAGVQPTRRRGER